MARLRQQAVERVTVSGPYAPHRPARGGLFFASKLLKYIIDIWIIQYNFTNNLPELYITVQQSVLTIEKISRIMSKCKLKVKIK